MKKGFTLVELLAVIIILAIIAVITTPIVLDYIEESEKKALLSSAELYLKAAEVAELNQNLVGNAPLEYSFCEIQQDGNLLCDYEYLIEVDSKGKKPDGGAIVFSNGKVSKVELAYGDKKITFGSDGTLAFGDNYGSKAESIVVYYDVSKGTVCSASEYNIANSKTGYNGIDNKTGNQNSCLKFYFLDEANDYADLILDHNTTATVAWNLSGTFEDGPSEVLTQLKSDTENWKGTISPENYTEGTDISYTINYKDEGYKARLVDAYELAYLTGNITWNGKYFSFDTKSKTGSETCTIGDTSGCGYGWLYDRTGLTCKSNGCLNNSDVETSGYWTASSNFEKSSAELHVQDCDGYVSYGVSYMGRLGNACVNLESHYGVRPVIRVKMDDIFDINPIICQAVTEETKTTGNVPLGNYQAGDEDICKVNFENSYHFFVVGTEGNKVNLILDRNINSDGTLATKAVKKDSNTVYSLEEWMSVDDYVLSGGTSSDYGSKGNNNLGPVTALNFTKEATRSWILIPKLNLTYTDENINVSSGTTGTSGYGNITITGRARLPKYTEVAGTNKCTSTKGNCPLWLVNYLSSDTNVTGTGLKNIAGINGYWTLPSSVSYSSHTIGVIYDGRVGSTGIHNLANRGIRPVITIPMDKIA